MAAILRLHDRLMTLIIWAGGLAVTLMMLQIAADVVYKWVSASALPFTSVFVANYYMVVIAFLPLALAESEDRHISVDLAFARLPGWAKRGLSILIYLLSALVAAGVAWRMWEEALKRFSARSFIVEQDMAMPIWAGYFALPLGFALLTLLYLLRIALVAARGEAGLAPLTDDPVETGV